MSNPSRLDYRSLGVAILIPFIAAGVQWLLWTHLQPLIFILFYPAVFFSAWIGGRLGGILATLLSAALVVYLFVPPIFTFYFDKSNVLYLVAIFIGMGCLFSYVFHAWKQANRRLDLMAQLQASERTLQLFVEHAPAAIAMFDRDMRYLAASRRYLADYRLPDQAIVGRLHYDVFPELPERLKEIHRRCLAGASEYGREEPFPRADGTLDWVHWEIHPWYEQSGAVGGLLLFSEVITARKQAEAQREATLEALQVSEANLKRSEAVAHVGHWTWDVRSNRLNWSDEMYRIFGINPISFSGNLDEVVQTAIHPDDRQKVAQANTAVSEAGQSPPLEYRVVWPDGTVRTVYAEPGEQTLDEHGRVIRLWGIVQDITQRKRAEDALRQSEERYRHTLDDMLEGCQIVDFDWRFVYVNAAAARQGHTTPETLLHRTMMDCYPGIDQQPFFDRLRDCMTNRVAHRFENVFVFPDGSRILTELNIQPSSEGIFILSLDITERKQAEQRVRYLARLYATLSQVNQTIVRVTDRQELFDAICQIAVDFGEFKLAWIGLFERETGQVTPVAEHGLGDIQLPIEHLNLNEEPFRSGLIGRALTGDQVAVANDVFSDQGMTHWYGFARQLNSQSIAAIPIHEQGQLVGVLNLYAADVDFFVAEEEQKLLAEMGLDISFALDTMQIEAQRRQTLAALRGSEARSRALIENAPDGIVLVTPTEFKYASPSALKLFGYQQAVLFQHGPADLTHPDDLPQVLAALTDLIQNPAHVPTVQYRFRHQTGSWRWIESTFSNLLAEPGVEAIVINFRDITERKQAETDLLESVARFQTLFEASPDAIVLIEPQESWTILDCNSAACEMNGYTREELIGQPIDLLNLTPGAPAERHKYIEQIRQAGILRTESRHRRKDGSIFPIDISTTIISLGGREVVLGIDRDITERKQAEEALRQSEEQYRFLVDNTSDFIARFDQTGVMVFASGAAYRFNGYLPEELMHTSAFERIHPDDQARVRNELGRVLGGGVEGHVEYRVRRKSGDYMWVEAAGRRAADPAGEPQLIVVQRDITERKQVEEQLRQSQAQLLKFAAQVPGMLYQFEMRPDGSFCMPFTTEAIRDIFGCSPEDVRDDFSPVTKVIHPEDQSKVTAAIQTSARDLSPFYVEYRVVLPGQPPRWVQAHSMPEKLPSGSIVWSGFNTDVSERKAVERALAASEERHQQFIAQSFEAISRTEFDQPVDTSLPVDEQIDLIYQNAYMAECNQAMAAMYHLSSAADMIGMRLIDAHGGKDNPVNRAAFRKFIEADYKSMDDETMEYTADGEPVWFLSNTVGTVENGQLVRLWGTSLDITARKRTEAALRDSEKKYRDLLNGMNDTICVIDADTTILDVNNAATLVLGYTRDELLSMKISDIDAELTAEQIQGLASSMPHDKLQIFETSHRTKDGRRLPVEVSSSMVSYLGRTVIMSIARDITERKRAEIELQRLNTELEQRVAQRTAQLAAANDRLLDLDRLKSKFVSDVSHELRTPVTSLSLYIDLLEYGKPEKREQYVGKLKEQMARLHTLINDILDLSRLERDRDEGGRSPVDINSIVEHVTATQLIAAETAGLVLTSDVGDNLPAVVARPDQLTRAITNVVSNAIKYTPTGSVRVQTRAHDRRVCIEVTDTGRGIPADELPHLFERFYRGHAVAQSTIPGSGLGLSIVKEIVESHGGTVDVASELGKGTTFRIWLPVA